MKRPQDELEFQQAYNRISDAYIALDASWHYTHVNPKAGQLLGREPADLIGKHVWTEFPTPVDDPFRAAYEHAMAEQRALTVEAYNPQRGRWFENRIYPSPEGLTVSFLDVTERRRAEILEAGQHRILAEIATQAPLSESLEKLAELHEALNPGALCSVLLLDKDRRHVLHGAGPSLPGAFNDAMHGQEIGDARGSCGTAMWRRERVVVADIARHPYWEGYREIALAHGLRACWSTPILGSREQVLGSFAVYYREPREPTAEEMRSIEKILSIAAIAIESDQLLAHSRERDYFFDMTQEIYCIFDTRTKQILQGNPMFSAVTGYASEELAGRHHLDFVHPDDAEIATSAADVLNAAGMRVSNVAYRFLCKDGSYRWLSWESIVGPEGLGFAVARDVTDQRETEAALAHADRHDGVTGLPKRSAFELELTSMLAGAPRVWIFLVGLDRFHSINESMGHAIGDEVLKRQAERVQAVVGGAGRVARFAGDQFVVAMPGLDERAALAFAERLREAVADPVNTDDYRLVLTASIGISHSPDHGTAPQDLLRRAEAAMARVKHQGRDGVCLFSAQQMREIEERLLLGQSLRGAAQRGEMRLHYQPQRDARSGALLGFEALLRWDEPSRGAISPASFIPVAEALGLMPELGRWVVDAACRQARAWRDQGRGVSTINVNVSMQELQRDGLVAHVDEALRRHGVPPEALGIELTESSLMENVARAHETITRLKSLGIRLALDDFGTGYSSLAYLKQLPIDKLKIDQGFVRGLPDDGNDAAIARTIVAMGHQLGMVVAAEGVETEAQADFLRGIGCDELQGYLYGRPVPADEAEALFAAAPPAG